jgi:hypothetical protein
MHKGKEARKKDKGREEEIKKIKGRRDLRIQR